jgi:3-mercaptopyruvate sulfurtransferase SseA
MERGYTLVRPLAGGLDGWMAAGYRVEAEPLIAVRSAESGSGASL